MRVKIVRLWQKYVVPVVIGVPLAPFLRICIATSMISGLKCMSRCCRNQHCLVQLISCERCFLSEFIDLKERTRAPVPTFTVRNNGF